MLTTITRYGAFIEQGSVSWKYTYEQREQIRRALTRAGAGGEVFFTPLTSQEASVIPDV
jgi:hypothetical protein